MASLVPKIFGPRCNLLDFFAFDIETEYFIFAFRFFPGKIHVKDFGSWSIRSICYLDLENEAEEAPTWYNIFRAKMIRKAVLYRL